jgi:hypothetical protein
VAAGVLYVPFEELEVEGNPVPDGEAAPAPVSPPSPPSASPPATVPAPVAPEPVLEPEEDDVEPPRDPDDEAPEDPDEPPREPDEPEELLLPPPPPPPARGSRGDVRASDVDCGRAVSVVARREKEKRRERSFMVICGCCS